MRVLSKRPRHITVSTDARYLSAAQIMERFGVSHMWIIRRMASDGFPRPIRFTHARTGPRFWLIAEVEQWESEHITLARDRGRQGTASRWRASTPSDPSENGAARPEASAIVTAAERSQLQQSIERRHGAS
jgi:predicted DNA-binding transcriptional regulator AlpA